MPITKKPRARKATKRKTTKRRVVRRVARSQRMGRKTSASTYDQVLGAIKTANEHAFHYNASMAMALKTYGEKGPWIAGVGQEHFPASVKDYLRSCIRLFHAAQDAVGVEFKRVHPRTDFYRSPNAKWLRDLMIKAGGYGTGK